MIVALEAAEAAGGDVRGRQSAALVVGYGEGARWERLIDVGVDDDHEPLGEVRRLVRVRRAYLGDAVELGRPRHNPELLFWTAVAHLNAGDTAAAEPLLAKAYAADAGWRLLLERLPAAGLLRSG